MHTCISNSAAVPLSVQGFGSCLFLCFSVIFQPKEMGYANKIACTLSCLPNQKIDEYFLHIVPANVT